MLAHRATPGSSLWHLLQKFDFGDDRNRSSSSESTRQCRSIRRLRVELARAAVVPFLLRCFNAGGRARGQFFASRHISPAVFCSKRAPAGLMSGNRDNARRSATFKLISRWSETVGERAVGERLSARGCQRAAVGERLSTREPVLRRRTTRACPSPLERFEAILRHQCCVVHASSRGGMLALPLHSKRSFAASSI